MAHRILTIFAFVLLGTVTVLPRQDAIDVQIEKNVQARMRDGVVLRADVYRPGLKSRPSVRESRPSVGESRPSVGESRPSAGEPRPSVGESRRSAGESRPSAGDAGLPVLLQRTPYSKNDAGSARRFSNIARRGFIVVVQDTRGRYTSDGVAVPHDEAEDGYDTVQWAAGLRGSNGRVGMFGGSYLATTQLQAATRQPPALVALFPASSYSRRHDMVFQGGAFYLSDGLGWNLGQAMDVRRRILTPAVDRDGPIGLDEATSSKLRADWLWRLPLKSLNEMELQRFAPGYLQMLSHPDADAFWNPSDIETHHNKFLVPAFHLTGWYDTLLTGTLRNFTGLRANAATDTARRFQRLVIGPWTHARPNKTTTAIGDVSFGPDAGFEADEAMLQWFEDWLRPGTGSRESGAPIRLFVMGENKWRDEQEWPLARARQTPYYLQSGGNAATAAGDGRLDIEPPRPGGTVSDTFVYDPNDPVPTGASGGYSRAPIDRRAMEQRADVLVYTTAPLTEDVEVTGPLALTLWIASTARDTDFTGTLVDVHPDGTARALADGILRARYRLGKTSQTLLTPGEPTEITIDLGATSNLFRAGHRIRVEVSSSNFPRFDRNPNTGGVFGEDAAVVTATQTILHDAAHPSRLLLPIVPRAATATQAGRGFEQRFMDGVSTDAISAIHQQVTEHPHIAGSARSMEVADRVRRALQDAGLETEVREFLVHLSTPKSIAVDIISPTPESLSVREPALDRDPDSAHPDLGPAFVAYSASGTVTAPVVYVNYGLPPDYERLAAAGIDMRGKIAMARYARSHRAVKVHTAEQAGAAGIIIYSDPADDGFVKGATWPDGPWRADFQSQSGNAKYSWFWHGDPLTPGVGATPDARALDPAAAPTLPKIPAVVLPWKEATKILSRLEGQPVPAGFQGGLPFSYRLGPGPVTVKLDVQMDAGRRPIRNVLGRITGRDPDRWVVLGTHHDAWSFGGMDPGTGLSPTCEVARGLAALARSGWRPERSIVFAFWDAEEFGLVGSTEYAEAMQAELREKAIVYINTDLSMRGRFDGGGTPSLRDFLVQVTKDVPHYDGAGSVYDHWRADEWSRQPAARRAQGPAGFEVDLAALGSGADFVAFQDFLGLPTLQMEFDFEGSYGPYHSNYDTRQYVERHVDPGFKVGQTLARVLGLTAMRLATAEVLPFRYSYYAKKIEEFVGAAEGWALDAGGRPRVATNLAAAKKLAADAVARATAIEARLDARAAAGAIDPARARAVNDALVRLEQQLLDESEPPETRWYRHVIYGWNIYSLYAGQPIPGLDEAIRVADPAAVARETARLEQALGRFVKALESIAVLTDALDAQPAAASFVIANARVVDGTGAPARQASVRVADGRITAVGDVRPTANDRVIDAGGLVLAPGFIDTHNHSTDGLLTEPLAVSQISQGITTLVVGQDGSSPWPIADYLGRLRREPAAVNVLTAVGHATIRRLVMGDDFRRVARADEVSRMVALTEQGMREGAVALSSGLEYEVGSYATTGEVVAMAQATGRLGGFYISHVRDEADKAFEAMAEVVTIAEEAKLPVQNTHLKLGTVGVWRRAGDALKVFDAARAKGLDVTADVYPYNAWASTITVLIPSKRYDDPVDVARGLADVGGAENVLITRHAAHPEYEFKTLAAVAASQGITPVALFIQIVKDGGASVVCTSMVDDDIRTFYQWPWTMVASDGGIGMRHPRGAGTFPKVLGRFVRENGWLTLEDAVRKMTTLPAARLKLADRGAIRVGAWADLVLFDPATVIDHSTFDEPFKLSTGIRRVWVNGESVWEEPRATGARPGRVITR